MNERTKEVIKFIASFLVDTTGNEIFEKLKSKRKISKILKEDNKNIKRIFYTVDNSDLYNLIEEFILFSAFKDATFYSSMDLTIDQEEKLWEKFSDFIKTERGENYVNGEYREKIIRCINLHNKAINSIIIDEQGNFQMKMMQRHHNSIKDSLNYIINTLNTETKLQDDDDELNFSVEQLEMIMKSYRYDINQLRRIQILAICGTMMILLLMSISIPFSIKSVNNFNPTVIMLLFLLVAVLLLLVFWRHVTIQLRELEIQMEEIRQSLWNIHFKLYENQIATNYMGKKVSNHK